MGKHLFLKKGNNNGLIKSVLLQNKNYELFIKTLVEKCLQKIF